MTIIGKSNGERITNAKLEKTKSKNRSITTSFDLSTCQFPYEQILAKVRKKFYYFSLFHFLIFSKLLILSSNVFSLFSSKLGLFLITPIASNRLISKSSLSVKNSSKSFSPVVSLLKKKHGHFLFLINLAASERASSSLSHSKGS